MIENVRSIFYLKANKKTISRDAISQDLAEKSHSNR